jgi:glutamine---fructose-6-phosphate transaminase (isomerizing)
VNRIERIEYTRTEMLGQPEAIRATLESTRTAAADILSTWRRRNVQRVYFVGSGDSFIVGEAVAPVWQRWLERPAIPMQALEFARYGADAADATTAVVIISASGGSGATLEGLRSAMRRGAVTFGLTNTADTPLISEATHHLLVNATRLGWPTQSSTAPIAALLWLGLAWRGTLDTAEAHALLALPQIVQRVLDAQDVPMRRLAEDWRDRAAFFLAGGGPAYAAARLGAAKIKEMSQDHAQAMFLEEYHHYYSVKRGEAFFLVVPPGALRDRALDTARSAAGDGAALVILRSEDDPGYEGLSDRQIVLPAIPESLASVVYAVPLQLFAQHLAIMKQQPEWSQQDHQGRRIEARE